MVTKTKKPPTPSPAPDGKAKKGKGQQPPKRNVIYPEKGGKIPDVIVHMREEAEGAMTCQQARDYLGWQESDEPIADHIPELYSLFGKYIKMENNNRNRPLIVSWIKSLAQEHLNRQWRFNGESISIGVTGIVLSGQHRFISLLLAEAIRQGANTFGGNQSPHWQKAWPEPITMETIIVRGIPEDDDVFKTLNQGKPGTTAHILYRSEFMKRFKAPDRKAAARITQYALKMLWERTGAGRVGSFTPRQTPSEAMDFLARHPKIMDAVETIHTEDGEGKVANYLSPGYASALLYMMAVCETDGEKYRDHEPRGEGTARKPYITFTMWDKAVEFWVGLCKGKEGDTFQGLREALGDISNKGGVRVDELCATLIKGWNRYAVGDSLEQEYLMLQVNGADELDEVVTLDGIDLGDPLQLKKRDRGRDDIPGPPPKIEETVQEEGSPTVSEDESGDGEASQDERGEEQEGESEDTSVITNDEVVYSDETAPEGELVEANPEDNGVYTEPTEVMVEPEPVPEPPVKRPKRLRR